MDCYRLPHNKINHLLEQLRADGYDVIGPQVRDGAIIYDSLNDAQLLPWGVRDHQQPGSYELIKTDPRKAFAWANGPQAIKPLLFKPQETLWRVARDNDGQLTFDSVQAEEKPIAILGARACDIKAMLIQDKVLMNGELTDPRYQRRREKLFVIAANCTYSSNNCFCVGAGGYPKADRGFDLALTELDDEFLLEVGSPRGQAIIDPMNLLKATQVHYERAAKLIDNAAQSQTKKFKAGNDGQLQALLMSRLNHPRWEEVAERCLSCGNCTSVCPTCFCHREIEQPQLDGDASEHVREWDSCFTAGHSYYANKIHRDETKYRYRQWLTHKVATWHEQFGTSGCVGCGRCTTWCPVGIDITEEVNAITDEI